MNILSEYNKFAILGPTMRPYFFTIFCSLFSLISFSQHYDAKSNALAGAGVTDNTIWSNFNNQAGLAEINKFTIGVNIENSFGLKELSTKSTGVAIPVNSGVFGANITSTGFALYNENKIGLAFAKKLSNSFNIGVQIDYLAIHADGSTNNKNNFTFEIGIQKRLMRNLTLGSHIFNPLEIKLNKEENIPSVFKLGLCYDANQKVAVFTEGELESNQNAKLKIGLGYKIIKQMELRTGFSTKPAQNSFGIGYILKNIQIDIAVRRHQVLGYSPQLSVSSSF